MYPCFLAHTHTHTHTHTQTHTNTHTHIHWHCRGIIALVVCGIREMCAVKCMSRLCCGPSALRSQQHLRSLLLLHPASALLGEAMTWCVKADGQGRENWQRRDKWAKKGRWRQRDTCTLTYSRAHTDSPTPTHPITHTHSLSLSLSLSMCFAGQATRQARVFECCGRRAARLHSNCSRRRLLHRTPG